jgi:hypothetical protein
MNTPTHLACGACMACCLERALAGSDRSRWKLAAIAVGAVALGILSHLVLDRLPHYAWIVYLNWFEPLPFHWLIREALFGVAVALPALYLAGRAWPFVVLGMFGGMYPDVEKVLSVDFHIPRHFILFPWHSTELSSRTGGLPKPLLIGFECILIAIFFLVMWLVRQRWSNRLAGTEP